MGVSDERGTSVTTRRDTKVSSPRTSEGYVTKFAPHKARMSFTSGKLTLVEKVVATQTTNYTAVAPTWYIYDSPGRVLASTFSQKSLELFELFLFRSAAVG